MLSMCICTFDRGDGEQFLCLPNVRFPSLAHCCVLVIVILWICTRDCDLHQQNDWLGLMPSLFQLECKRQAEWCHVQPTASLRNPGLAAGSRRALQRQPASKKWLHQSCSWCLGSDEHVSWYQARSEERISVRIGRIRETRSCSALEDREGHVGKFLWRLIWIKVFQLLGNECSSCKARAQTFN